MNVNLQKFKYIINSGISQVHVIIRLKNKLNLLILNTRKATDVLKQNIVR